MQNYLKKDYAPQFNKLKPRSITAKEVFEILGIASVMVFGTYIILGLLGLL